MVGEEGWKWRGLGLPVWTDHWPSGGTAVGGALESAFRISLGSDETFEVALSGGESGVDMIGC